MPLGSDGFFFFPLETKLLHHNPNLNDKRVILHKTWWTNTGFLFLWHNRASVKGTWAGAGQLGVHSAHPWTFKGGLLATKAVKWVLVLLQMEVWKCLPGRRLLSAPGSCSVMEGRVFLGLGWWHCFISILVTQSWSWVHPVCWGEGASHLPHVQREFTTGWNRWECSAQVSPSSLLSNYLVTYFTPCPTVMNFVHSISRADQILW